MHFFFIFLIVFVEVHKLKVLKTSRYTTLFLSFFIPKIIRLSVTLQMIEMKMAESAKSIATTEVAHNEH